MSILAGNTVSSYVLNASSFEEVVRPELFHTNARLEKILRNRLVQLLC